LFSEPIRAQQQQLIEWEIMAPDDVKGVQAGVIPGRAQTVLLGARNDLYNHTIVFAIAFGYYGKFHPCGSKTYTE